MFRSLLTKSVTGLVLTLGATSAIASQVYNIEDDRRDDRKRYTTVHFADFDGKTGVCIKEAKYSPDSTYEPEFLTENYVDVKKLSKKLRRYSFMSKHFMENWAFTGGSNMLLELGNLLLLPAGWHHHTSPSEIKRRLEDRREGVQGAKTFLEDALDGSLSQTTLVTEETYSALEDFSEKASKKSKLPACE